MPFRLLLAAAFAVLAAAPSAQPAECVDGRAAGFECDGIDLLAFISPEDLGAPTFGQCPPPYPELCANDIWGWTDPETARRYAIIGLPNGTAFVDLSEPAAPVRLGLLPTATASSSWRDVKAVGNVAVIVSEARGHGMQVFDLTRLRGLGEDAARRFEADARYTGFGSAHNVAVNEETMRAYAVGSRPSGGFPSECGAAGLHAVDLSDPMQPAFLGCFSDALEDAGSNSPGYTHDVQCVVYRGPDADYQGRETCFASNENVVTIFEVNDAADARVVSQIEYPNDGYTHQGWLTEDQRYFLANDEFDELIAVNSGDPAPQRTLVMDVQDLDAPEFAFEYRSNLSTVDHNLYVLDGLAFQSNYESGLRVVSLDGLEDETLEEVAFFDTYTPGTSVNFAGQWSNYPFFGDGLVIVTDGETGFFILQMADAMVLDVEGAAGAPGFSLSDPSPNPTASRARAVLEVATGQAVRAELFDVAGRRVASVFEGAASAGAEVVLEVETGRLPAGVYVLRVTGETFEASKRLVLTR